MSGEIRHAGAFCLTPSTPVIEVEDATKSQSNRYITKPTDESCGSRAHQPHPVPQLCVGGEPLQGVYQSRLNISHILVCSVRFSELLYKNLTILNYEGNLCHLTYLSFLLGIQKSKTETNGQEVH